MAGEKAEKKVETTTYYTVTYAGRREMGFNGHNVRRQAKWDHETVCTKDFSLEELKGHFPSLDAAKGYVAWKKADDAKRELPFAIRAHDFVIERHTKEVTVEVVHEEH